MVLNKKSIIKDIVSVELLQKKQKLVKIIESLDKKLKDKIEELI